MKIERWIAAGVLLLAIVAPTPAQERGRIEGRVITEGGSGVGGVAVVINETGAATISDTDGSFYFAAVPEGAYTVSFTLGDETVTASVEVAGGETAEVIKNVSWDVSVFETITVYSASRRVERIVEAPAAITSVTSADVSKLAATGQLPKVLEFTPGVEVTQSGLYDFNFNTRGFNSSLNRRVAVRIDGRDPAAGFLASQDWATTGYVMEDTASVELLRGPSAALYGANAFNGVLNIVTKLPKDSPGGVVKLTGGELSTIKGDLRLAGALGSDWYGKLLAGWSHSDDWFRSRNESVEYPGLELEAIPLVLEEDEIWYGSGRLDKYFGGGRQALTLEGGTGYAEGPVVVTGIGRVQITDNDRPWARLNFNTPYLNFLASYTNRDADDQRSLRSGVPLYLDSDRINFELQGNTSFFEDRARLVGGVSYKEEDIDSANLQGVQTLMFGARSEDFSAVFGQFDFDLTDALKVVLAARYDEGSLYDGQFSPKGALVWSLNPNNTLRFSYNEAFQVPNYSEFFLQADVAPPLRALAPVENALCAPFGVDCGLDLVRILALGNESLEVEEISTIEAGYSGIIGGKAYLTVDYYFNEYDNFITDLITSVQPGIGRLNPNFGPYVPPAGLPPQIQAILVATLQGALGPQFAFLSNDPFGNPILYPVTYTNFGEAEAQGVDVGLNWFITPAFTFDFAYSWFDFDVQQQLAADPILPNAPENRFSVGLGYSRERFAGNISYRWTEEFPWAAGVFKGVVEQYELVDVGASYDLTDAWRVGVTVTNLLDDESYQTFGGDLIGRRALGWVSFGW